MHIQRDLEEAVDTLIGCDGFEAAGVAAGIKKKHALDLGMIFAPHCATAAAVFTRNRVQAAPVVISMSRLASGRTRAVIVNSGNANCCTGNRGLADAHSMTEATAMALGIDVDDVCVASTGVIGARLPIEKIRSAIPAAAKKLAPHGFEDFARAIMTTDTVPKLVQCKGVIDEREFTLLAAAKGAGMIRPDMATLLCFICTDAEIEPLLLRRTLRSAVDCSLNRISIDGDTSTNDMVLVMASGKSGARVQSPDQIKQFEHALRDLLMDLSRQLVRDGEGVNKVVRIEVCGARSDAAALQVADTVAHSPLVKTAFFGEDANWGRIIAAVGRSGIPVDPERVDLYFDDVLMFSNGQGCGVEAEELSTAVLMQPEFCVRIDLNHGPGRAALLTCDFSVEYVRINADYRS